MGLLVLLPSVSVQSAAICRHEESWIVPPHRETVATAFLPFASKLKWPTAEPTSRLII